MRRFGGAIIALGLTAACTASGSTSAPATVRSLSGADPGRCTPIDVAVAPDALELTTELAHTFNRSKQAKLASGCAFVRPSAHAPAAALSLLTDDWPDERANGARPIVWLPGSRLWGALLNERRAAQGRAAMAPADAPSVMTSPLVVAMPKPMAEALGYPDTSIGLADLAKIARDPAGWGAVGRGEWGPVRLARTNPRHSTSGLLFTIVEQAAADDVKGSTSSSPLAPLEAAAIGFGDSTGPFLANWQAADARGTALTYLSALAVEERSVIDYNAGRADGRVPAGERAAAPKVPLVAVYPKEGTLSADYPYLVLEAPWVDDRSRQGALAFGRYLAEPSAQRAVAARSWRPANPAVALGATIARANGVDPREPARTIELPRPGALASALDAWDRQRRPSQVLFVIDVSGSMGEPATGRAGDPTKLELAKRAVVAALERFRPDDIIGLRIFSTRLINREPSSYVDLVPLGRAATNRDAIAARLAVLAPTFQTPLYEVTAASYDHMLEHYDGARINAVVLLTDGRNEDGATDDDSRQLTGLLQELEAGSDGAGARTVRMFPIRYGRDADADALGQIARASGGALYDASDPTTIERVFDAVVSNF